MHLKHLQEQHQKQMQEQFTKQLQTQRKEMEVALNQRFEEQIKLQRKEFEEQLKNQQQHHDEQILEKQRQIERQQQQMKGIILALKAIKAEKMPQETTVVKETTASLSSEATQSERVFI